MYLLILQQKYHLRPNYQSNFTIYIDNRCFFTIIHCQDTDISTFVAFTTNYFGSADIVF